MTKVALRRTRIMGAKVASNETTKNLQCRESIHKTPLSLAPSPLEAKRLATNANSSGNPCLSELRCQPQDARQMCVSGLNHFNISASRDLIEQVKRFYTDVIGLALGPRAHLDHEGYWLYAGCTPIVHLSIRMGMPAVSNAQKGYFNHISLGCVGLRSAIAKMIATQTPYRLIQLPDIHQTQLFVTDPAGIGVELTFFNESL